jgi:hypothetical protein
LPAYVVIKNKTIDHEVAQALLAHNNAKASRWESYRHIQFIPQRLLGDGTMVVMDAQGNELRLAKGTYEEA